MEIDPDLIKTAALQEGDRVIFTFANQVRDGEFRNRMTVAKVGTTTQIYTSHSNTGLKV
jgi:hypothetical protein